MVSAPQTERRDRLERSRLYLVCAAGPDGVRREELELPDLIRSAVAGGVDVVQLREKRLADDELTAVASAAAALCRRLGALLIVNDRPAVAAASGADGIHVGQDDLPVQEVREIVGPGDAGGPLDPQPGGNRRGRSRPRRLHRRRAGARDAHQARPSGGGPRAGALRGRERDRPVLRDRRPRRRQPGRGGGGGRQTGVRAARDHRLAPSPRRRRASCAGSSTAHARGGGRHVEAESAATSRPGPSSARWAPTSARPRCWSRSSSAGCWPWA